MYSVRKIRYFEKPDGIDIFAELYRGENQIGWLEQAAYQAPHVFFDSLEIKKKFETETGQIVNETGWEEFVEAMIQKCEREYYGPAEYDKLLQEVLNG